MSKKIKKYVRKLHWHKVVGSVNVVPINEYKSNIQYIIDNSKAKYILLIDTYPNRDKKREPQALKYNKVLEDLSDGKRVLYVPNYQILNEDLEQNYDDSTHMSSKGQQIVADAVLEALRKAENT